jgi:hypothetical protein
LPNIAEMSPGRHRSAHPAQVPPHLRRRDRLDPRRLVPAIIDRLDDEHPYDVPGGFALPIVATSPAYRQWILDQTAQAEPLLPGST